MRRQEPLQNASYFQDLNTTLAFLSLLIALALLVASAQPAQAQTYQVLYNFTNSLDGGFPRAGLTLDRAGSLYGTTSQGGAQNGGTVFKMALHNSSWIFSPLYSFAGGNDGFQPVARVIIGPNGSLYGTTLAGGGSQNCGCCGCGTVFNLQPNPTAAGAAIASWRETVLHRFTGDPTDGQGPQAEVIFDQAGSLYGTTFFGGSGGGTVFKMTPGSGGWTESTLYNFDSSHGGPYSPNAGVVIDNAGNLYGTTVSGAGSNSSGVVYQLTHSGSGWIENTIFAFGNSDLGAEPYAGVIFDSAGNLIGATTSGVNNFSGAAFELTPSNGNWIPSTVYKFSGIMNPYCGNGPYASLFMDTAGNLYGTNCGDSSVFELTPTSGGWVYTLLHSFDWDDQPLGGVVMDAHGNLYGTTETGGTHNAGEVWEITP